MGHEIASSVRGAGAAWRLAERLSALLDPRERDAVWGDVLECRASGPEALRDVAGLVVRRHAGAWLQWQPWAALLLGAIPLGIVLSFVSRWWADGSAIYLHLYEGRLNWAYLQHRAARGDFIEFVAGLLVDCAALAAWSWTCGVGLGTLSRRTRWIAAAICVVLVFSATAGTTTTARAFANQETFALPFYGTIYPLLLRVLFVVLPLAWGVRTSARIVAMRPSRVMWLAGVIVALTAFEARGIESSLTFGARILPPPGPDGITGSADDGRPLRLLPLAMMWPAVYLAICSVRRRKA